MKKFLAVLLSLMMVLSFTACSGSGNANETWQDELGNKGTLRVGMAADYPPYESYDASGKVVGFDADMAQAIADELGVQCEIIQMDFDTIITAVAAGTVDLGISCFSYNEERAKSVLFTDTYMTSSQACFASSQYGVKTMEDLKDGVVGAGNGTTGMDVAEELKEQYGYTTQAGEIAVMTEALKAGTMKGIITEQCVANAYINANPDDYVMIENALTIEEIQAVTNLENDKLQAAVNDALKKIMGDEKAYNDMILKWFDN